MAYMWRKMLYPISFINFVRKLLNSRTSWLFLLAIVGILSVFQLVFFFIVRYGSSVDELQVAQANLDAKLFQSIDIDKNLEHKSDIGSTNLSPRTVVATKYFCGFPVLKDATSVVDKSAVIGAIVLLKGGITSTSIRHNYTSVFPVNSTVSRLDFETHASIFCAKKLISQLPNPMLSRFMTFLERVAAVPLTTPQKAAVASAEFCATADEGDPLAHELVRAFAVANQLASAYTPSPSKSAAAVRLFIGNAGAPQTRLEALALLTAMLTTWAGDNETRFQDYIDTIKPKELKSSGNSRVSSRQYQWLTEIDDPRFCIPSDAFSCNCPRLLLVHSMAERRRAILMASLRQEAGSLHAALPAALRPTALPPSHPDWPHRVLAALSEALCNQAVPLGEPLHSAAPKALEASNHSAVVRICDDRGANAKLHDQTGCVSEAVVRRLWDLTSYAEKKLRTSQAQSEYAKLSSYPFLRILEQGIQKFSPPNPRSAFPWLQVYAGQPDSIFLLLHALNVSLDSIDRLRTAGRLVVEILRNPDPASTSSNLRFLLDGVDIGSYLAHLQFCSGNPVVCRTDQFVDFLSSAEFWGQVLDKRMGSSQVFFNTLCASSDVGTTTN